MKNLFVSIALVICSTAAFVACNSADDLPTTTDTTQQTTRSKMDLLTREWYQSRLWENEVEKQLSDNPLKYQFNQDGTYGQAKKDDDSYLVKGIWRFSLDSSQIVLNEGQPFEQQFWISELDETTFKYEWYQSSSSINYVSEMKPMD